MNFPYLPTKTDYNPKYLKNDLLAGVTVAIVALPLALAFGVTSGAGASAGLITAIVAGVVAAIFGGSSFQVSGPTGAMTAVLLPIAAQYGASMFPLLSIYAGVILLALAFLKVGRYVSFIPWPVITGFTNGIAIIIFLQQLPYFLDVEKQAGENILHISAKTIWAYCENPSLNSLTLGLISAVIMLFWPKIKRAEAIPASIVAISVATIISLFPFFENISRIGAIPRSLPMPILPDLQFQVLLDISRAAFAIAALSAIESLVSAVVADSMTIDHQHDPDRELFGQGLANIASGLFGGIPATAAFARTAVNVRSGAKTRASSIIHGLCLFLIVLFFAPLASKIPLAALGAILMIISLRMIEREAIHLIWNSTRADALVLILTTVVTILFDLILAIEVGLIAAGILFIKRMSEMFSIDTEKLGLRPAKGYDSQTISESDVEKIHKDILTYRIDGPLFFGATNRFFIGLLRTDPKIKVVILRMRRVPVMDATGATVLKSTIERLTRRKILVFFSGIQKQPHELLRRMGILDQISRGEKHVFERTDQAIAHAYQHLAQEDHFGPTKKVS